MEGWSLCSQKEASLYQQDVSCPACDNKMILEAVIAPRSIRQRVGWGGEGKRKFPDSQLSIGKQSKSRWFWIEEHKEAMRQC